MDDIQIYEEHFLIRDTIGYEIISKIDVFDLPEVFKFLKICQNYNKMIELCEKVKI